MALQRGNAWNTFANWFGAASHRPWTNIRLRSWGPRTFARLGHLFLASSCTEPLLDRMQARGIGPAHVETLRPTCLVSRCADWFRGVRAPGALGQLNQCCKLHQNIAEHNFRICFVGGDSATRGVGVGCGDGCVFARRFFGGYVLAQNIFWIRFGAKSFLDTFWRKIFFGYVLRWGGSKKSKNANVFFKYVFDPVGCPSVL